MTDPIQEEGENMLRQGYSLKFVKQWIKQYDQKFKLPPVVYNDHIQQYLIWGLLVIGVLIGVCLNIAIVLFIHWMICISFTALYSYGMYLFFQWFTDRP